MSVKGAVVLDANRLEKAHPDQAGGADFTLIFPVKQPEYRNQRPMQ